MKNLRKKGFTIVELVIVVAVIAILAAVLIPTFSNLVKKANMSADQVAIRNMNTVLAMEEAESGKLTIDMVWDALEEAGFNGENYRPLTNGATFYWIEKINKIILADENHNVLYPTDVEGIPQYNENATGEDKWIPLLQEECEHEFFKEDVIKWQLHNGEELKATCIEAGRADKAQCHKCGSIGQHRC